MFHNTFRQKLIEDGVAPINKNINMNYRRLPHRRTISRLRATSSTTSQYFSNSNVSEHLYRMAFAQHISGTLPILIFTFLLESALINYIDCLFSTGEFVAWRP
ncbi:unnamed protein product [Hymenolepis diminuta]|uniref:Uncharacterized protein n=1 Tax=Hymenolepis diminuta TaxID=6216 RepID=A0A564YNG4_HYMDI|nr:unnamed protein product [Hymenolepis diminuta]